MKYIIELPEEPLSILALSTIKGIPKATKIETFEPYIEPDRKAIENEVWELLKTIGNTPAGQRVEIFETINYWDIVDNLTYPEAKAKYESWLKQRDEIRVGDEVKENIGLWTGVVVGFDEVDDLIIMDRSGKSCDGYKTRFFRKTGRHFDEVEELLKKMGDEK